MLCFFFPMSERRVRFKNPFIYSPEQFTLSSPPVRQFPARHAFYASLFIVSSFSFVVSSILSQQDVLINTQLKQGNMTGNLHGLALVHRWLHQGAGMWAIKKKKKIQLIVFLHIWKTSSTTVSFFVESDMGHFTDVTFISAMLLTFQQVDCVCSMNNTQGPELWRVLKYGEDEQAQGQMTLSSNLNQEEVLKPPILCSGIAAAGL